VNPGVTRLAIVVALVAGGIAVLAAGFGGETEAAPPPTTTSPSPSPSPSESPSPQDGEVVGQKKGVLVQVLNGTYTPGFAADFQATLEGDGYIHAGDPGDAPEKPVVETVVYFRHDDAAQQNEADAELLAETYLEGAPVERLPSTYKDVTDPAADVVVVLGEDMAPS
jgi:LytR cell envelope-related transcriptional attenuator